jgi:hypothetical protein
MNTLPIGITGFYHICGPAIHQTDKLLVQKLVGIFKNNPNFRTVQLIELQPDNNFYMIIVYSKSGSNVIGINSTYPMYCGIKGSSDWQTVEFYDLPSSITTLIPNEFTELKTDFLNESVKSRHLIALSKSELEQINYWETEKVGNIIFNKYD